MTKKKKVTRSAPERAGPRAHKKTIRNKSRLHEKFIGKSRLHKKFIGKSRLHVVKPEGHFDAIQGRSDAIVVARLTLNNM